MTIGKREKGLCYCLKKTYNNQNALHPSKQINAPVDG